MRRLSLTYRWFSPWALALGVILSCGIATPPAPAQQDSTQDSSKAGDSSKVGESSKAASEEDIRGWIADLQSKKFIVRERASIQLIRAGDKAITPVAEWVAQQRPEAMLRGIHVLKNIGLRGALASREVARQALDKLTRHTRATVKNRANAALVVVNAQRERHAIRDLTALGATIEVRMSRFNQHYVRMLTIRIDDRWTGTDEDLVRLEWLGNCEQVEFRGKNVKNGWFKRLKGMKGLRSLSVRDAPITDDAFNHLGKLNSLQYLDIRYCAITDRSSPQISQHETLTNITLYGTRVSANGADNIKNTLAKADVDFRRGAFLGIGCPSPPSPCIITTLQPETAAAKADIREQDIIVQFDKKIVKTFDDLRLAIGAKIVGDSATIVVIRPGTRRFSTTIRQQGANLGVKGEEHPIGVLVKSITEKSAAARMNLKPNDVIRSVLGSPVRTQKDVDTIFQGLVKGGRVSVEFTRDTKRLTKKVVFGRWNTED